jgi:integrase
MRNNGDSEKVGVFKVGPRWYYFFQFQGRQIKRASAVNSFDGAKRARFKALERIAQGVEPFERLHAGYTVTQALRDYVNEGASGRRASTQRHYTYRAEQMSKHLGTRSVATLDEKALRAYRAARYEEGVQEVTVNNELVFLGCAFRFAKARGLVASTVFDTLATKHDRRRVFIPYVQEHQFVRLDDAGFEKVLIALPREEHRIVARVALATGMRISEIVNLTWGQVSLDHVHLTHTKNGKQRDVPITRRTRALLPERIVGRDRVFDVEQETVGRAWRGAVIDAGFKDVHFHDLRHEWASRFIEVCGTLVELMTAGGWSSLAMVQRYARAEQSRIAAVMAKMDGAR